MYLHMNLENCRHLCSYSHTTEAQLNQIKCFISKMICPSYRLENENSSNNSVQTLS